MKETGNRQNQWMQSKGQTPLPSNFNESHGVLKGGTVFGLISDLLTATRIAKAAKQCHLAVHNFDSAESLIAHLRPAPPALIILDWDTREAGSFKVLKELTANADLKGVAAIDYVSGSRENLKREAQAAGCLRVYGKTELTRDLEYLLARYAK